MSTNTQSTQNQDLQAVLQQHMEQAVRPVLDDLQKQITETVREQIRSRQQSAGTGEDSGVQEEKPATSASQSSEEDASQETEPDQEQGAESSGQDQSDDSSEDQGADSNDESDSGSGSNEDQESDSSDEAGSGSGGDDESSGILQSAFQPVGDAIQWFMDQVRTLVQQLRANVQKFVKSIVSSSLKFGVDVAVSGFRATLEDTMESIKAWFKEMFDAIGERLSLSSDDDQAEEKGSSA